MEGAREICIWQCAIDFSLLDVFPFFAAKFFFWVCLLHCVLYFCYFSFEKANDHVESANSHPESVPVIDFCNRLYKLYQQNCNPFKLIVTISNSMERQGECIKTPPNSLCLNSTTSIPLYVTWPNITKYCNQLQRSAQISTTMLIFYKRQHPWSG